ncbi:hypothetical protein BC629DRAFT_1460613 [Irpex lacteus]|nr:hypothetical protein BC629DRAFT_1460613 [Irpex lacteus]
MSCSCPLGSPYFPNASTANGPDRWLLATRKYNVPYCLVSDKCANSFHKAGSAIRPAVHNSASKYHDPDVSHVKAYVLPREGFMKTSAVGDNSITPLTASERFSSTLAKLTYAGHSSSISRTRVSAKTEAAPVYRYGHPELRYTVVYAPSHGGTNTH